MNAPKAGEDRFDAVVVAAHPVRFNGAAAGVEAVATALRRAARLQFALPAFLDTEVAPSVDDALMACAERGARALAILPLLVSGGTLRVQTAVLKAVGRLRGEWSVSFAPALGSHPALADLIVERFRSGAPSAHSALLLVAHGNRDPAWELPIHIVARWVGRRLGIIPAATAFLEYSQPDVPAALDILVARGVRDIIVVPYFLHAGRHVVDDLPRVLRDATSRHSGVVWRCTAPLGDPVVLASVLRSRLAELSAQAPWNPT